MNVQKTILIATLFLILLPPLELFARAGGGGGGSGGGILGIILLPFIFIYMAILHYKLNKKNKEAKELLKKLSSHDPIWNKDHIKKRIEKIFFRVQQAWMERNQDLVKDCVSERLYEKHKIQTDQMTRNNEKNILEKINLIEAKIVEAVDFKDDSKDNLWVYIKGSMIDYTINELTNLVISGEKGKIETFTELWRFIRDKNDWVLDEIDQEVQIDDLNNFLSFSEGK